LGCGWTLNGSQNTHTHSLARRAVVDAALGLQRDGLPHALRRAYVEGVRVRRAAEFEAHVSPDTSAIRARTHSPERGADAGPSALAAPATHSASPATATAAAAPARAATHCAASPLRRWTAARSSHMYSTHPEQRGCVQRCVALRGDPSSQSTHHIRRRVTCTNSFSGCMEMSAPVTRVSDMLALGRRHLNTLQTRKGMPMLCVHACHGGARAYVPCRREPVAIFQCTHNIFSSQRSAIAQSKRRRSGTRGSGCLRRRRVGRRARCAWRRRRRRRPERTGRSGKGHENVPELHARLCIFPMLAP
jgi:hypothetical protein